MKYYELQDTFSQMESYTNNLRQGIQELILEIDDLQENKKALEVNAGHLGLYSLGTKVIYISREEKDTSLVSLSDTTLVKVGVQEGRRFLFVVPSLFASFLCFFFIQSLEKRHKRKQKMEIEA